MDYHRHLRPQRLDDGDLGAVVRAARTLDAAMVSNKRPFANVDSGPRDSPPSASFFSSPFSSSECSSSGFDCKTASVFVPGRLRAAPAASCPQSMLQSEHRSSSLSPKLDALDTNVPSCSRRCTGLLDSTPPFSPFGTIWEPRKKAQVCSVVPQGQDHKQDSTSTASMAPRSVTSSVLQAYLNVKTEDCYRASADGRMPNTSRLAGLSVLARPEFLRSHVKLPAGCPNRSQDLSGSSSISKSGEELSTPVKKNGSTSTQNGNSKAQGAKRPRKAQQKRVVCIPASGGTGRPTGNVCLPTCGHGGSMARSRSRARRIPGVTIDAAAPRDVWRGSRLSGAAQMRRCWWLRILPITITPGQRSGTRWQALLAGRARLWRKPAAAAAMSLLARTTPFAASSILPTSQTTTTTTVGKLRLRWTAGRRRRRRRTRTKLLWRPHLAMKAFATARRSSQNSAW